jgi:sulfoquinovosyltransferase
MHQIIISFYAVSVCALLCSGIHSVTAHPFISSPKSPIKIALLVEPTPFNYVSGYSNRFKEALNHLNDMGDQVHILTPDDSDNPPKNYLSFPIETVHGFRLVWYKAISLSLDIRGKTLDIIKKFKPDLLHATTPGFLWFPAIYHTYRNK